MKTARSIEEQEERKAARDNQNQPQTSPELTQPVTRKSRRGDASRTHVRNATDARGRRPPVKASTVDKRRTVDNPARLG